MHEKKPLLLQFGFASDLFWDPLGESEVKAAAQHGFSFLEIWGHMPWFDVSSPAMAAEVRTIVEAHGMRIRSVHAPCEGDWDISSESETVRQTSVEEVIQAMNRCREMGGELVVVHPGRALATEGEAAGAEHVRRVDQSIHSFKDIQQAARDTGILIALENQWANEVGGKEEHFLRVLETLDPRIAGICFDSSHANITPGTYEMFEHITHPIITTHLSDNNGTYDEHRPPFTAGIDWRKVLTFFLGRDFRGPWLFEVTNGGDDPLNVLPKMEASIDKMKAMLREITDCQKGQSPISETA